MPLSIHAKRSTTSAALQKGRNGERLPSAPAQEPSAASNSDHVPPGSMLSAKLAAKKRRKTTGSIVLPAERTASGGGWSDVEFQGVVEQITKVLSSPDTSWEGRVEALSVFATKVVGGEVGRLPPRQNLSSVLGSYAVKQAITSQLQDLRSAVVREACVWLRSLGPAFPSSCDHLWIALVEPFLSVLLHNRGSSSSAVSSAADDVLQYVMQRGVVTRGLVVALTHSCVGKNALLRAVCLRYLLTLMTSSEHGAPAVARYADLLAAAIRSGLQDAAEDCRRYSRLLFWCLEDGASDAALELYESLSESLQGKLDNERESYAAFLRRKDRPSAAAADGVAPAAGSTIDHPPSSTAGTGATTSGGLTEKSVAPALVEVPNGGGGRASSSAAQASGTGVATPRRSGTDGGGGDSTYSGLLASAKRRAGKSPLGVGMRARKGTSSGPSPLPSAAALGSSSSPTPPSALLIALRSQNGRAAALEYWGRLIQDMQSSEWATRVRGVQQLTEYFDSARTAKMEVTRAQTTEALKLLPFRLGDPHYRVVASALECFDGFLANAPGAVLEEMHELLPILFQHCHNPKAAVRDAARAELQALTVVFDPDVLLAPILRVLDHAHQQAKIRVSALEYLQFLIQSKSPLFTPTLVKHTLGKLMFHRSQELATKHSHGGALVAIEEVLKTIGSCIASLYQVNADALLRSVLLLPPSEQLAVFEATEPHVPHLEQDCRRLAAGERLLDHPEVKVPSPFRAALDAASPKARVQQAGQGLTSGERPRVVAGDKANRIPDTAAYPPQLHGSVSKAPESLFQDVSFVAAARDGGGGGNNGLSPAGRSGGDASASRALKHYDPQEFSCTTSKSTDLHSVGAGRVGCRGSKGPEVGHSPLQGLPSSSSSMLAVGSPGGATRAQIAARISAAVVEHRLPPDFVAAMRSSCDGDTREDALKLVTIAVSRHTKAWAEYFVELFSFATTLCSTEVDHRVRFAALQCLEAVVMCEGLQAPVVRVLPTLIARLIERTDDPFHDVKQHARVVFHLTTSGGFFAPHIVLRALCEYLTSKKGLPVPCLVLAMEEISETILRAVNRDARAKGDASLSWLPEDTVVAVSKNLLEHFLHASSEVRKTVVAAFVALWACVGDRALKYWTELTVSQKKLISIYYRRYVEENAPGGYGSASCNADLGVEVERVTKQLRDPTMTAGSPALSLDK